MTSLFYHTLPDDEAADALDRGVVMQPGTRVRHRANHAPGVVIRITWRDHHAMAAGWVGVRWWNGSTAAYPLEVLVAEKE